MTEVLSSEEIDQLLKAISTGEVDANEMSQNKAETIGEYAGRLLMTGSRDENVNIQIMYEGEQLTISDTAFIEISQVNSKHTSVVRINLIKEVIDG